MSERETHEPRCEGESELFGTASCSTATITSTVSTAIDPSYLSLSPAEEPRHPLLQCYPATKAGQQDRYFNRRWYEDYKWKKYSISKDRAFHFVCHHFHHAENHVVKAAFTHNGYHNRKKAISHSRCTMLVWSINMQWVWMSGLFRKSLAQQHAMLWVMDIRK